MEILPKLHSSQLNPKENSLLNQIILEELKIATGEKISLSALAQISFEAGEKIMEIYHTPFEVFQKEDTSPLTQADLLANEHICSFLNQNFPNIPIISEELKKSDYESRLDQAYVWLVDPLDGTKEFIHKREEFTVNLALCENGAPILGVVSVPAQKVTYFAAKGQGAYKIDHKTNQKSPIHVNSFSMNDENLRLVVSLSHMSEETQNYVNQFKNPHCSSFGSSLKLLKIAEGEADIYPRFAPTMEWDTCAAHAILKEAGGLCVNAETLNELSYNKENLRNPYFICLGQEL